VYVPTSETALTIQACLQIRDVVAWGSPSNDGHSMGDLCITIKDNKPADILLESLDEYKGVRHICWGWYVSSSETQISCSPPSKKNSAYSHPCGANFLGSYDQKVLFSSGRMTYDGCVDPKLLAVALRYPVFVPRDKKATCVPLPLPSGSEPILASKVIVYCYTLKDGAKDKKRRYMSRYVSASEYE